MKEMLGNHYFMLRDYKRALPILEEALSFSTDDLMIMRKLVICYTQVGLIRQALRIFLSLIKKDIEFVINTDPIEDDCPCPHLIYKLEKDQFNNPDSFDYKTALAMYWLYCDVNESLKLFADLAQQDHIYPEIQASYILIKSHLKNKPNHQTKRRYV